MKPRRSLYVIKTAFTFFFLSVILWGSNPAFSYPVKVKDMQGHEIIITKRPSRVVSLVPSITEITFNIGAGDAVKGVTYHDTYSSDVVIIPATIHYSTRW